MTISSSQAQCVTSALPGGDDSLTAAYSGNATYASSSSSAMSYQINALNQSSLTLATTSTTFTASPANTATLNVSGGSTAGAVTYQVDSVGNTAGCSVSGDIVRYTSAGTCSITATMAGNADYNPVSSADTPFSVHQAGTTTVLGASPSSSDYGSSVTLTATVTSGATGTVSFEVGGVSVASCGAVTISSGEAQCATTALPGNTDDVLTAVYSGDVDHAASTSANLDFDVSPSSSNVLTFTTTSPSATVGGSYTPGASSSAGLTPVVTVDASSSAVCSISGGTVRFSSSGQCVLDANQPGDADYAAAAQVQQIVTVRVSARAPSTPLDVSATFGSTGVVVTWSAPATQGSAGIEGYTVSTSPGGATCSTTGAMTCTLVGLSDTTSYTVSVVARSNAGTSPPGSFTLNASTSTSTSGSGTGVPSAPTNLETTSSGTNLTVSWTAPSSVGTSPVTGYRVTISPGGKVCTTTQATSCTLTGLSSLDTYHVSVVALSAVGTSRSASTTTRARVTLSGGVIGRIRFAFNSSALNAGDRRVIDQVASTIVAGSIRRVTLEGYTDSVGTVVFNDALSAQRAAAAGTYLREILTLRGDRTTSIAVVGKGIRQSGTTAAASRVVIVVD